MHINIVLYLAMALQHFPTMAENGCLPIQTILDPQASMLDLVLFPGSTCIPTAVQEHLTIDLNLYVPLLCIFGLLVFACRRICEYLLRWLETYSS
jgi:hypothetical protein